jgi:hypothetical protein
MYVCMYVCASAHTYALECICAQIVCASAHTCALVCFVCVSMPEYNYLFAGLKRNWLCICASVPVPVYVCMYVVRMYI